jgi:hypothetical protein
MFPRSTSRINETKEGRPSASFPLTLEGEKEPGTDLLRTQQIEHTFLCWRYDELCDLVEVSSDKVDVGRVGSSTGVERCLAEGVQEVENIDSRVEGPLHMTI